MGQDAHDLSQTPPAHTARYWITTSRGVAGYQGCRGMSIPTGMGWDRACDQSPRDYGDYMWISEL